MKTFKFRAWDSEKMYYQVRCGGEFDGIPTAPTVWDKRQGDWTNLTGQPYTKIMQYTGLKDSNCAEIYEGDILRLESHQDLFVIFSNGCFVATSTNIIQRLNWKPCSLEVVISLGYRVIGNVYENPELLTA